MDNQTWLSNQEQQILDKALYYLKMAELKQACQMLHLPDKGKKMELITRIMTFVQTRQITGSPAIPASSRAKNYPAQPHHPKSLMLYGAYKNDAQSRAFFKQLIGPHFHFTAFGIDWLNERWLKGNPPTYQEFADYWTHQTEQNKLTPLQPKDEWQYINFVQQLNQECPELSKSEVMERWKKAQADKAREAFTLLELVVHKMR